MHLRQPILLVLFLGMSCSGPIIAGSPEEVFSQAAPSIVVVEAAGANGQAISLGSGVTIAPGQVITNCHVIKDGKTFTIRQGNNVQPASVRYQDVDRDLCQLEVTGLNGSPATLVTGKLKTGQRVYAIGAPQGLEPTISEGLISGLRELDGAQYIQTTAAISSGGGLFDENGYLIGIATLYVAEGQSLNFSLPVAWIAELPKRAAAPAVTSATDSTIAWLNKAVALEEKQDFPGLLAHTKKWTLARPQDAQAWFGLGIAYGNLKQTDKAIEAYREALRINPEHADAWISLGNAYGRLKQIDKAIEAFLEALRINPEYAEAWSNLGNAYDDLKQTDKAIAAHREALRINPEHADAWNNLGAAYGRLKQTDGAIAAFREALRINPEHADAWNNLGVTHRDLKQTDKAIAAFREALRINPEHADAWINLGNAYGRLKQTDKAIEAYREALRINPEHVMAWNNLGVSYYIQGNRGKVSEIYQTLRKLDPERADKYFNTLILP